MRNKHNNGSHLEKLQTNDYYFNSESLKTNETYTRQTLISAFAGAEKRFHIWRNNLQKRRNSMPCFNYSSVVLANVWSVCYS